MAESLAIADNQIINAERMFYVDSIRINGLPDYAQRVTSRDNNKSIKIAVAKVASDQKNMESAMDSLTLRIDQFVKFEVLFEHLYNTVLQLIAENVCNVFEYIRILDLLLIHLIQSTLFFKFTFSKKIIKIVRSLLRFVPFCSTSFYFIRTSSVYINAYSFNISIVSPH